MSNHEEVERFLGFKLLKKGFCNQATSVLAEILTTNS